MSSSAKPEPVPEPPALPEMPEMPDALKRELSRLIWGK
jgi:hypothetical protein